MQCKKCGNSVAEKEKFCWECGTKIEREALCKGCGSKLKLGAKFCSMCGQDVVEQIVTQKSVTSTTVLKEGTGIASAKVLDTYTRPRLTKTQSEKLSDAEKKIIPKLKKDRDFIVYDNERNLFFMQRDNWSHIEVIKPSDITNPVAKFTFPKELGRIRPQFEFRKFLFYTNIDAFIAWGDYIFVSIYKGHICWSAADIRDGDKLPGGKINETIFCSGVPELEFLPNSNVKIDFTNCGKVEYRIEQGLLIPCN